MKIGRFLILLVALRLLSCTIYSQIDCESNPIISPVLTFVSVQPETGYTVLKWTLSPSLEVVAYVVYTFEDESAMAIDTLWDPNVTSYTYNSVVSKYFSMHYVVAAYQIPRCTSPLSNALNTIFCRSEIDTCKKEITINWNSYTDYPNRVLEYKIMISKNGTPLTEMHTVSKTTNSFTLTDFTTNSQYCFAVKAMLEDGSVSTSNKSCLLTKMQRPPGWINADYASVNSENKIDLSFSIDPLSEIKLFSLERKSGQTGIYETISQPVSANNKVVYTDNQSDAVLVNFYRLSAINSCNRAVTVSNISSNMVLDLGRRGNDINLTWNGYKRWLGPIESYRLFMNSGDGFTEKAMISTSDSSFTLGYQDIMYEVSGSEVCFYVSASESSNPYGVKGESLSNRVCTAPTEIITVPNVFTPNNDLVNDFFRPVLSFTPLDYQLIISNRQGRTLFETRDHNAEWDGTENGNPQPQGVCLWFLKVTTPSGKSISKTGTLTIITDR